MTCCVGILAKDKVFIGADSAEATDNGEIDLRADPKLFARNEFIFAFAGSWRYGQIIQYEMKLPELDIRIGDSYHSWMVRKLVPAIQKVTSTLKDEDKGDLLVGFSDGGRGHLYAIYGHNYQVASPLGQFYAIGSGSQVAKGSLSAGLRYMKHSAQEQVIKDALYDASQYTASVRPPFLVLST